MARSRLRQSNCSSNTGRVTDLRIVEVWWLLRCAVLWLCRCLGSVWRLNPVNLLRHRMRSMYKLDDQSDLPITPRWTERISDLFTSETKRKARLLDWVNSRVKNIRADDFTYSWHDGVCLCALLESVCPGVCPRYHLLKTDLRVNNCKYGLQVAHTYLAIHCTIITPEELAIADKDSEQKIIHLVQMLRWKHTSMPNPAHTVQTVAYPIRRILGRCFARGTGLKSAMVSKRATFNIIVDSNGHFDLLVEICGPNGEQHSKRITSPRRSSSNDGNLQHSNGHLNTTAENQSTNFIRQISIDEDISEVTSCDCQRVGEGRFLITYTPMHSGFYGIVIKFHDHHIQGSPFEVFVSEWVSSWNSINRIKLPFIHETKPGDRSLTDSACNRFLKAREYASRRQKRSPSQLTVARRRILKKYMTRNGEEVVVSDYSLSPTLSRQSSIDNSDVSEEDSHKKEIHASDHNPSSSPIAYDANCSIVKARLIKEEVAFPDSETSVDSDSLSVDSSDNKSKKMLCRKKAKPRDSESSSSDFPISSMSTDCAMSSISSDNAMMSSFWGKEDSRTTRFPIQRSMSDSMTMSFEVMEPEIGTLKLEQTAAQAMKKDVPGLALLRSFKSLCFTMGDTIDKPELSSANSDQSSVSVVIRPRPTLMQIHKLDRKWQSVDTDHTSKEQNQLEEIDLPSRNSHTLKNVEIGKTCNSSFNVSSIERTPHDNATRVSKGDNSDDPVDVKGGDAEKDTVPRRLTIVIPPSDVTSWQSLPRTLISSEVQHSSDDLKIPSTHGHVYTQVSSDEITRETGWHPNAVRLMEHKTYKVEHDGNVRPENNPITSCETEGTREKKPAMDMPALLEGIDQKAYNVCNVMVWLNDTKNITRSIPSIDTSDIGIPSIDTSDIGIPSASDIGSSVEHNYNRGHRNIIRRRHRWHGQLNRSFNEDVAPGVNNASFSGYNTQLEINTLNNSFMSDSEVDYGSKLKRQRYGMKLQSRKTAALLMNDPDVGVCINGSNDDHSGSYDDHSCTENTGKEQSSSVRSVWKASSKRHVSFKESTSFSQENDIDKCSVNDSTERSDMAAHQPQPVDVHGCNDRVDVHGCNDSTEKKGHVVRPGLHNEHNGVLLKPFTSDTSGYDTGFASLLSTSTPDFDRELSDGCIPLLRQDDVKADSAMEPDTLWPQILPGNLDEDEECTAFGLGLTHGYVGIKNNFQVWARYPAGGTVGISICGPKPHCVIDTSTTYTGDSLYEVTYEVTLPGSYVISVKWCDQNVANSPFIACIVFD